jgi:hypothetical protein
LLHWCHRYTGQLLAYSSDQTCTCPRDFTYDTLSICNQTPSFQLAGSFPFSSHSSTPSPEGLPWPLCLLRSCFSQCMFIWFIALVKFAIILVLPISSIRL